MNIAPHLLLISVVFIFAIIGSQQYCQSGFSTDYSITTVELT
jgi:hypothetical protein